METVGERVYRLRKSRGLSQKALAARACVTSRVIWRLETGASRPRADSWQPLARALGVTIEYLMTGREAPQLAALHNAIRIGVPRERLLLMCGTNTDV